MASPNGKQRLELTWIGKENRPRLEPRILLEDASKSHHAARRVSEKDLFDNRLIFGDNLLALKALEQEYIGKVKCIYIDPPYNTGSAFEHYDDGLEHSLWLTLMRDRLDILYSLLTHDGSLWVSIDDHEMPYLRLLLDERFGRSGFVASIVWQKRIGPDSRLVLGDAHDYIVVYSKDPGAFRSSTNRIALRDDQISEFKNPDNDPRGPWTSSSNFSAQGYRPNQMYKITTPGGAEYHPPPGRCWVTIESQYKRLLKDGRMWFGQDGRGMPRKKTYLSERTGQVAWTWWPNNEVGHTQESKKESIALFGGDTVFGTPKPERLIQRILAIASTEGDLVLDSFAGSGTTGAVAQKMGRRWIMIELGEHIHSHIIPRMKKVIDGEDHGGISEAAGWKGGGGFRYFRLASSLLQLDRFGNHVISSQYNAAMLAEAMCKLMGFTFSPGPELYWQQGRSTETDFLYTTTQTLSRQQLESLSEEVGPNRSLMVCCSAFRAKAADFPNLTLRKIPMAVLARCEWGKDDYSLNVANLPQAPAPPDAQDPLPESAHADRPPASPADARRRRAGVKRATNAGAGSLFETPGSEQEVGG